MTVTSNARLKSIAKSTLFCAAFTALLVVFSMGKGFVPTEYERLAHGILGTLAALLTTIVFLKVDKKQFSDIGLTVDRKTAIKFFSGFIIGVLLMGLLATGVIYFTSVEIELNDRSNIFYFLLMTAPLLPLAFMEELGFRAYPLQILKDKAGIRLSILITSVLFALYHIANGWSVASSFYGPGVWGLVFGLSAIYSKGIAMPTAIHYAANLVTAAFGAKNTTESIWVIKQVENPTSNDEGIDWVTIIPSLALLMIAIICIEMYMRRKTIVKPALANAGQTELPPVNVRHRS